MNPESSWMTRLLILVRCQSCSSEKFGVKTEFAVALQLSDDNEPVVKIMSLKGISRSFY